MKTIFGVWFVKSSEIGFIVRTVIELLEATEMVSKASTWNTYLVHIIVLTEQSPSLDPANHC